MQESKPVITTSSDGWPHLRIGAPRSLIDDRDTDAIRNRLSHLNLQQADLRYKAQSAEKGPACIIDVTPEHIEFLVTA